MDHETAANAAGQPVFQSHPAVGGIMSMSPHQKYADFLQSLTVETLPALNDLVTADVRFKDPFNDVRGVTAMTAIFAHMFATVGTVKFTVSDSFGNADTGLLAWRFEAQLRGRDWCFDGTSVLKFDCCGRVAEHIDHWDAARDFYERLPLIGWQLAWARQRIANHSIA